MDWTCRTNGYDWWSTDSQNCDIDHDWYVDAVDCNSNDPAVNPGAVEKSGTIDMNCNGMVAENSYGRSVANICVDSTVNPGSGNLYHSQALAAKPDFVLSYNSLDNSRVPLGRGWTHNYNINITANTGYILTLTKEDGKRVFFRHRNGAYYPEARSDEFSSIVKNANGTYTRTTKEGTVYAFNASGKLTSITDRNHNQVLLSYTGPDLTSITDAAGRVTQLIYDAGHHIIQLKTPDLQTTTFSFDVNGNLSGVADPAGNTWQYTYNANGLMLTKTDPAGNTTTYAYDANNRLTSSTDSAGKTKTIAYDPANNNSSVTERDGGIWTYKYDPVLDVLTEVTDPQNNITRYAYDASHNLTSKTDPDGSVTTYTYDANGNRTSETDALNQRTSYTYNAYGQVTGVTDPQNHTISYAYDANGNLTSATDAAGAVTQYQYDQKGNIIRITDAAGGITTLGYDAYNNITSITDPVGAVSRFAYDINGNITSMTDANGAVTGFTYNNINQLIKITDPEGRFTTYTYDAIGNLATETDANGNTASYEYRYKGRLTKITDALGNVTTFAYTPCSSCGGVDKLTNLTDAKGNVTSYTYDNLGRFTGKYSQAEGTANYGYDSKGNLTFMYYMGRIGGYTYDAVNRLVAKSYNDGTSASFQYDSKGNITFAGNRNISYNFTYDANGRLTGVTDSNGRTISYTYDVLGRRTGMTMPDGRVVHYAYDAAGRLSSITPGAGQPFGFTYDAGGRRTNLTYPNGVTASYTYDPRNRLTGLAYSAPASAIDSFAYTYDNVGNRLTRTDLSGSHTYGYDAIYEVTWATHPNLTEAFTYDATGNRLSETRGQSVINYTYAAGNRIQTRNGETYTFDGHGEIYTKTDASGTITYQYDMEDRLIKATMPDGSVAEYKYDPFGRRIEKKVTVNGTATITRYLHDGANVLSEYEGNNTLIATYVHNLGIDDPLSIEKGGATYYYHRDGLGSITSLTDATGNKIKTYEYDSFGNITAQTGALNQPYAFTGREYDSETGLYYYRARYYDPKTGRFISKDPIGFAGGDANLFRSDSVGKPTSVETNLYSYTGNDPVNWIDPWGLYRCVGNASCDFTPAMDQALRCFDQCTGRDNLITSGKDSHSDDDPHMRGEACDIGRNTNPGLSRGSTETCFAKCFTNGYGQEERNSGPGTHYHMQNVPGVKGATGFAPGIREHGRRRP